MHSKLVILTILKNIHDFDLNVKLNVYYNYINNIAILLL